MRLYLGYALLALGSSLGAPLAWGRAPTQTSNRDAQSEQQQEALRLLQRHMDLGEAELGVLEADLLRLRSSLYVPLFEALSLGGVPAHWNPEGGAMLPLAGAQLRLIERSLLGLPSDLLRSFFQDLSRVEEREVLRVKAFQMLAKCGTSKDVSSMLDLATPLGSRSGLVGLKMRRSLEAALLKLSEEDERTIAELGTWFRSLHEGLQPSVISVLGQLANADALALLVELLNTEHRLNPYVLSAIARCARLVPHPIDSQLFAGVRACLEDGDMHTALGAMRALGPLEDYDALPFLIAALAEGDEQMRQQAWHSLQELTGLAYNADQAGWQHWYQRESAWWRDAAPRLGQALHAGSDKDAREAIRHISGAKLDRHRLADLLLQGVRRADPDVLRLTCIGLGRLGSRVSIPALIKLLDHRSDAVAEAAHGALMQITKMKIPALSQLWLVQTSLP